MATFFNQATLVYRGQVTNSNVTTGEIIDVLAATETALSTDYGAQDTVTYAISLVNSGQEALTNVTLNDTLGAYTLTGGNTVYPLEYVDGSIRLFVNGTEQTAAPTVTAGPPLAITGINVPAGANALLVYEARTNEYAPLAAGSEITSTLSGTGGGACGIIASAATIPVRTDTRPSITKFATPDTVVCNGEITYTFIVQNNGNGEITAQDGLIIQDTFNPILTITAVEVNGTALPEGTGYTYNAATGEFATVLGQLTVDAASYEQDEATGVVTTTPGVTTLTVTGNV